MEAVNRSFQPSAPQTNTLPPHVIQCNRPCYVYEPTSSQDTLYLVIAESRVFVLCRFVHKRIWRCLEGRGAKNLQPKTLTDIRFVYGFCNGDTWATAEENRCGFVTGIHPSIAVFSSIYQLLWGTVSSTEGTRKLGKRRRFHDPNIILLQTRRIFRPVQTFRG
jgi:hypothetical protein